MSDKAPGEVVARIAPTAIKPLKDSLKPNLFDFDLPALRAYLVSLGEAPFRATQILKWLHFYGVQDFDAMTNLSKALRAKLAAETVLDLPEVVQDHTASCGTRKWLLRMSDGNCIETVYIPDNKRGTLCVSSQVGCALDCKFCSTGAQGFNRNLTTAEIIGQVWVAVRRLSEADGHHDRHVTNVVMMGMGEPLLNFEPVVSAMRIMLDDNAYMLSKKRVTLSTSGVVPEMRRLSEVIDVSLAVSLHAPEDALRSRIMPINRKYPLDTLLAACRDFYHGDKRRHITFEYVMLDGVNDTPKHARTLIRCLEGIPSKVNLIPFNPFPNTSFVRSDDATIDTFQKILIKAGLTTLVRRTRGDDIDAACGQLVGNFNEKTRRRQQRG